MENIVTPYERTMVEQIRSGKRAAKTEVATAISKLEAASSLNLLTAPPRSEALDEASALDTRIASGNTVGPLAGLPVVVKDNIAMEGLPLAGASPALGGYLARETAGVVKRLTDAGAIIVGRTNMHELAFGITSENPTFGAVRTPYDLRRMSGGSSGGTAAAIGCGAVFAGLASDTGGSGRIPAAFCGIVGLRPTINRYPADGLLNLSTTMDTVAAMARTVDGISLLDAVLSGDAEDTKPADLAQIRLGVPRNPFWNSASKAMNALCNGVLKKLEQAGVTLIEIDATNIRAIDEKTSLPLVLYETYEIWSKIAAEIGISLAEFASRIVSPDVAGVFAAIASGQKPDAQAYRQLLDARATLQQIYAALFAEHRLDGLVFPTTPITAPLVGYSGTVAIDGRETTLFQALISMATPTSLSGIPGISIPAGLDNDGLPFGIEIDAPSGHDRRLIAVARSVKTLLGPIPRPKLTT